MATRQDIEDAIHDELVDLLASYLNVSPSDVYENVRLSQRGIKGPLPAYTYEIFESDPARGIGDGTQVIDIQQHSGTADIVVGREKAATVDITAHAAGDDRRTVNDLYNAVEGRFTELSERFTTTPDLHSDVDNIVPQGSQQSADPDDNVRGDRYRVNVEYDKTVTTIEDIPTMEVANLEVGMPVDETLETVAFDQTIS